MRSRLFVALTEDKTAPFAKIHMALMRTFTRTAVLSFSCAVAIGAAAEAQPLSTDRDMVMVTGVSVAIVPKGRGER